MNTSAPAAESILLYVDSENSLLGHRVFSILEELPPYGPLRAQVYARTYPQTDTHISMWLKIK